MTADQPAPGPYAIVTVASSAGGIRGLTTFLGALGPDFPVPLLLVQHLDPRHRTVLDEVLERRTELPVRLAVDGTAAAPGTVYIAPPDRHLLVGPDGVLELTSTEPVHFVRPSADRLFESAAHAYGPRTLACVLTGTGVDGAQGALAVRAAGGSVIAQDPGTAEFPGMPQAAVDTGAVDFVLPLEEIAAVVSGLVGAKRQ
ncbi:chemotaxis protein CheB [Streptomyces flavofungini]|uniref:chemotaxis protein CheB n=1 Tax=Streptomyces flavofungini TaxID=68200 RepID=UPI0034E01DF9